MRAEALALVETDVLDVPQLFELQQAFAQFTAATSRLEHEYATLRGRVAELTGELEEKNRLLAASLERERRLEAEALRQSRLAAMGEMAAMLAHEVRNPLGAMELFTGLLLQDLREQAEPLRLARQVAAGIADLDHLVTNLLEFTRTRIANVERVDCLALVEDALRYTADLRVAHGVSVVRALPEESLRAHADQHLLRPVLLNLVRNALQAMPTGGTLAIAAGEASDYAWITVADSGAGIAPDVQELIFRPFYTTRARGTGLGLSVARELVTAMGGRLTVTSEPGHGATFMVEVPRVREASDA